MTQVHETAYPRLKSDPSPQDLEGVYTLTAEEIAFVDRHAKRPAARAVAFIYLKLYQRLGYFERIARIPPLIRDHIVAQAGYPRGPRLQELRRFEDSGARQTLITALRRYQNVRPLDRPGQAWLEHIAETAADLIGARRCIFVKDERGLYTDDPKKNSRAAFIPEISVKELLARDLDDLIIERPCLEILQNSEVIRTIQIINGLEKGNLTKALSGKPVGTLIHRS